MLMGNPVYEGFKITSNVVIIILLPYFLAKIMFSLYQWNEDNIFFVSSSNFPVMGKYIISNAS